MTPKVGGPEDRAREEIDKKLTEAGWVVQSRNELNLAVGRGVAVREFPLEPGGFADYLLFVDEKASGVLEAKPEGFTLKEDLRAALDEIEEVLADLRTRVAGLDA